MEIIKLQQLQDNFNSAIENSINQKYDIDSEIKEVAEYINTIPAYTAFRNSAKPLFINKANRVFEMKIPDLLRDQFSDAFKSYLKHGNYEFKKLHIDTNEMYQIKEDTVKQAYEFSEYYKWLCNYNIVPQKEEEFNVGLRLLSLEYLGVDLLNNDKTKIARTLAPIIGMHPQTIRTSLTYLHTKKNEIRTIENLLKLQEFFKNQGHTSIVIKIQKEIEAIK